MVYAAAAIHGTVVDGTKVALPGATVKLSVTGGQEQIAYTDENGKFEFPELPAGSYTVTAEMDGFQPVTSKLDLEETPRNLEIVLPPNAAVSETVSVSAESEPMLEKSQPEHKSEIGEKTLDYVPIPEQRFQDVLPLVPSIVRGPDGSVNINGARSAESSLLVNGSNVTDPVTGNFAIELPIEAVDNVEVYTNPYSAEYGKFTGGVTKVSTKPGEDKFKVEFNDFMPRLHFTDGFKTEGLEAWKPRLRVSGPTGFKNLYFSQAVTYNYLRQFYDDLPEGGDFVKTTAVDSLTQFDFIPSTQHQMTFTVSFFPQTVRNANLNTFLPVASTPDLEQGGYNLGFQDRHFFKSGAYLESSFSEKSYDVTVSPKEDIDSTDFTISPEGNTGNYFNYQDRTSDRTQWLESFTFAQFQGYGTHQFRVGLDLARTRYSGVMKYGDVAVNRKDGSLYEMVRFEGSGNLGHSATELSNYVQDSWTLNDQVALDVGLRLDYDSISSEANPSPRIAFSYAPKSLSHTVFKGGVGYFYDKVFLNAADFEHYPSRVIDRYDTAGKLIDSSTIVNRMGDVRAPRSRAFNIEVNQEAGPKLLLRSSFTMRDGDHQFKLTPLADEFLLTSNGDSHYWELEFTAEYRINKENNVYLSYVRSHARGDTNDFNTYLGNFQSPLIHENVQADLPFDTPNRLLFWGVARAPYKIVVSPVLEIRDGFPYSAINQEQQFVGDRNSLRFPKFVQLDMRVTRTFHVFNKYDLTAGLKVLNVLNHFNPRDVQNNLDSDHFGTFYNGIGRLYRGAFEIKF